MGWTGIVNGNPGLPARPGEGSGEGGRVLLRRGRRTRWLPGVGRDPGARGEAAATPLALSPTSPAPSHLGIKKRV